MIRFHVLGRFLWVTWRGLETLSPRSSLILSKEEVKGNLLFRNPFLRLTEHFPCLLPLSLIEILAVHASSCTSGFSFFPRMEKPFPLHQLRMYLATLFPTVRNIDLMGDALITTLRPPCPMSSERSNRKKCFGSGIEQVQILTFFYYRIYFCLTFFMSFFSFYYVINPSETGNYFQTLQL